MLLPSLLSISTLCVSASALVVPAKSLVARENWDRLGYGRGGQGLPDLYSASIDDIRKGLESGAFTSVDLTAAYIARIEETNPLLHSVLEINPYALESAAELDAERAAGKVKGGLHGIPILVKDNIATARPDQTYMNTTAGSFALLGSVPPEDATMARKLKEAGAIILGKTNLSQWANYRSSNSTNGWSARGNQTTGAYLQLQDPSGSSSGSGVAASIGLSLATLGTETSGSILSPAQRNNLAAIKPTVGLTSRYLVIPISVNQDTIGPMCPDMKTCAAVLHAIAGKDDKDAFTDDIPFDTIPDYEAACKKDALEGARIGVPSSFISSSDTNLPELIAFNASLPILRDLGASVQLNANFPALAEYRNSTNSTLQNGVDFIAGIKEYFGLLTSNPESVTDIDSLIDFTTTFPAEEYPDRNIARWTGAVDLNLTQQSPEYIAAVAANQYLGGLGTILGALENNDLDALVLPTSQSAGVAAIAGYPVVTVPLGFYPSTTEVFLNSRGTLVNLGPNLPFGLAFIGRRFSEEKLIAYAYAFEQKTKARAKIDPLVLPNIQLTNIISPNNTFSPDVSYKA